MTATYQTATDDMYGCITAAWKNSPFTFKGVDAELRINGIGDNHKMTGDVYWGRLSRRTVISRQATLSTCVGAPGQVRYMESGLLFVQLFGPRSDTQSPNIMAAMAQVLRNALRRKNTHNGVWFRNARINELTEEEKFNRMNVVAEFHYDEII